jgi:hypothetical protein
MTEIEDVLSRALAAEAGRHEPPVFNAYRIAETAVARRRFWRRPLFSLVAAAIGVAGAGGATVLATGGGQHRLGDAVTVTIQSRTGSVNPQTTDASVKAWVRKRAAAEGLKDVTASVRHNPWRLQLTGHLRDLELLKTFAEPGILQIRPTIPVPSPAPAWVADPVGVDYRVVASRSLLFSQGTDKGIWGDIVTFDDAGRKALADYSRRYAHQRSAIMIDGAVVGTPDPSGALTGGEVGFAAGQGRRAADVLGAILTTQGPADLEGATITVSTR